MDNYIANNIYNNLINDKRLKVTYQKDIRRVVVDLNGKTLATVTDNNKGVYLDDDWDDFFGEESKVADSILNLINILIERYSPNI